MTNETSALRPFSPEDRQSVMDIFNWYIENSFAAYPEHKLGYEFFDMILNTMRGYPTAALCTSQGEVIGFGFLKAYNPMPTFKKTAEITYFIKPEYTAKGLGNLILDHLLAEAEKMGLKCILANISSLNQASLKFHRKNGFTECGRFKQVGQKNNTCFDVVWMQRLVGQAPCE